jgi:hypothetical protein
VADCSKHTAAAHKVSVNNTDTAVVLSAGGFRAAAAPTVNSRDFRWVLQPALCKHSGCGCYNMHAMLAYLQHHAWMDGKIA